MSTILLGQIVKIRGYNGTVTVRKEKAFTGRLSELKSVFLEIEGRPVPFFVEYIEPVSDESFNLKFEDYDTFDKVKEFAGCNILLPASAWTSHSGDPADEIQGFKIESADGIRTGTITGVVKNPGQLLLKVVNEQGEDFLVPFHEDLIRSVDKNNRIIIMTIPDGLTELNR